MRDYGFLVALGAGFLLDFIDDDFIDDDFIEDDFIEDLAGLVAFMAPPFAGALVAVAAGFVSAVFWSSGFFVALGAGLVDFIDEDFIDEDFIDLVDFIEDFEDFIVLLVAVFGAGLAFGAAAIAGAVIRNAVARSDARIFFMCVHLLP
jgi:hypothetical protein